ncbi:MAG: serine hydrolase domain-containing protein [Lautropia sp.]
MRLLIRLLIGAALLAPIVVVAALAWLGIPRTGAGMAAKAVCSGVFVADRPPADVIARDVLPASPLLRLAGVTLDGGARTVHGTMLWSGPRAARWLPGLGCVLDPTPELAAAATAAGIGADERTPFPSNGAAAPAPWPDDPGAGVDRAAIARIVDEQFAAGPDGSDRRATRALLILHDGRLLAERYGAGFDAETRQIGWSMTKTVLGMLVIKRLAEQNLPLSTPVLEWIAPARRPAWLDAWQHDQRRQITVADLLLMRDGLAHVEGYAPWSAVPRMLWNETDVAAYVGAAPADAPAGSRWRYLSASTNLLSGLLRLTFDDDAAYWRYPETALLRAIGANSMVIESDASGNLIASSYGWATPRDFARIGELIRRQGASADGTPLLPPHWWQVATAPPPLPAGAAAQPAATAYGAQTWLPGAAGSSFCGNGQRLPADTVALTGHWGQLVAAIPSRGLVVVRLGMTLTRDGFDRCALLERVAAALPASAD